MDERHRRSQAGEGRVKEVFAAFVKLGLTSFGGPIAHIGYFRRELVERRRWVDDRQFAQLFAVCQFLPGPSSSQLGFSLGLLHAGWMGALAAFVAFTLPSAVLMFTFASAVPAIAGVAGGGLLQGLKLVALAVVAHGVLGMTRQLCPDVPRATIAIIAAVVILVSGRAWVQLLAVAFGALAGLAVCRDAKPVADSNLRPRYGSMIGWMLLVVFGVLLIGLPLAAHGNDERVAVIESFYRAGSLVFGGGHVVLPLLEETVVEPGWISADDFLAGYGAAQAVPGPMFTLSVYLGARLEPQGGVVGAALALAAIFLPGFLLIAGVLPFWSTLAARQKAARAIAGINAAVVGLLGAALYDPVWVSAIRGPLDLAIALVGFTLFTAWRASALLVVTWCIAASVAVAMLH